jgi:hypothetical protein
MRGWRGCIHGMPWMWPALRAPLHLEALGKDP